MVTHELEAQLDFAVGVAGDAGRIMLKYFDAEQGVVLKADNSPVTKADIEINNMVIQRVAEAYPEHGVIGEEASTETEGRDIIWFCDPVDGTKAYTWGLPTAMFSLAQVVDGRPVLGVTYDPFLKRMYTAIRGDGSYCNGQPLHVSDKTFKNGIFAASGSVDELFENPLYRRLREQGVNLATYSGFIYKACSVAGGKLIGSTEKKAGRHDIAAAELIVREAGGMVTDLAGVELDYTQPLTNGVVISNGVIHQELLKIAQTS